MTTPIGQMRSYRHGEHLIFGATARVITQFLDLLEAAQGGDAKGLEAAEG